MPRKKSQVEATETEEKTVSSLPEKFEVFEEEMTAKDEPKPAPKKATPFVEMVETTWSGLQMWRCPKCAATTFKQVEAETHTCKRTKWADEAEA